MLSSSAVDRVWIQTEPTAKLIAVGLLESGRPGCGPRTCACDESRRVAPKALLLLGGDKAGNWQRWYRDNIPLAERLYLDYTAENQE